MATIYLDVDDEITSAAARIRESKDLRIALVLPSGSRIATSRINFKLLQREARERSRRLAIVTPEASARALAASAGLAVFASVRDYEEHLDDLERVAGAAAEPAPGPAGKASTLDAAAGAPAASAGGTGGGPSDADADVSTERDVESGSARGIAHARPLSAAELAARDQAGTSPSGGTDRVRDGAPARGWGGRERGATGAAPGPFAGLAGGAVAGRRSGGRRLRIVVALVVALFVVGVGGAAAYLVLPTARVVLTLRTVPVGPLELIVHADPQASAPDATELIVPAIQVDLPLSASGTFPATGKRTDDKPATGTLMWTNCDPTRSYTIPKGVLARTQAGVGFTTDEAIFLPVATLNPPRIGCQSRTVTATAAKAGVAGNVAAGTVTVVPGSYNSVVIRVRNPNAMAGGSHQEFPKVVQKDVDGALAALSAQLDEQLKSAAAAPADLPPGATVFPATATRGEAQPGLDPASLVGTEVQAFDLSVTATGTVVAVDPSPLQGIGAARLAQEVPPGNDVVAGSTSVTVGPGTVADGIVSFSITAREESVPRVDAAALRGQLKGKTPAEVRAQLGSLGDVAVTLWPDWVSTVTGFDARLDFTVTGPSAGPAASPGPVASPGPSPSSPAASPLVSSSPGASGASPAPSASAAQGSPGPSAVPSASGATAASPNTSPSASPAVSGAP